MSFPENSRVFIGVDFGTTHTGAAFIRPGEVLKVISSWPTLKGNHLDTRVPSRMAYAAENPHSLRDVCGFQITPNMTTISWIKLALDPSMLNRIRDGLSGHDNWADSVGIYRQPEGRDHVRIITDILTYICKRVNKALQLYNLECYPKTVAFTHPATWSAEAIAATRQAAADAGFGNEQEDDIVMISEPQAALSAILIDPGCAQCFLQPDDGVIVCDLGGGTADIASYSIYQKKGQPPIQLTAHTEPLAGSTAIDRGFYKLASENLIQEFDNLGLEERAPGGSLMTDFESVKCEFKGAMDGESRQLAYSRNGRHSQVKLSQHDIHRLFYPIITNICHCLSTQISEANRIAQAPIITKISLTGGFANSSFLVAAIRRRFENTHLRVYRPDRPHDLVAKGAAILAKDSFSREKISFRHYGVGLELPTAVGDLMEMSNDRNGVAGDGATREDIYWFLAKGEHYQVDSTKTPWLGFQLHQDLPCAVVHVYDSEVDDKPRTVTEKGVRRIGQVIFDFTPILESGWQSIGQELRIQVTITLGQSKIDFEGWYGPLPVGSAHVEMFPPQRVSADSGM
ncbi:actin-like ATPase domain-containing protein [Aspergillus ellipticus CBS 707.79]|uniref:Actin-like ATPase domain-containing protein n=1 Tax=Aspergillus ellipticus CBS 707.79 TaxID=1448320 RepID=A0A319D4T7_9EURO|nr:actin-like ATPase domain-containing protein [Aspergillus ellipticus CBS 707.79]